MRKTAIRLAGLFILFLVSCGLLFWWFRPSLPKLGPPVKVFVAVAGVTADTKAVLVEARLDKTLITANITVKAGRGKTVMMLPVGGQYLLTATSLVDPSQTQMALISITTANQVVRLYFDDWGMDKMLAVSGRDIRTQRHQKVVFKGLGLTNAVYNELDPAKLSSSDYTIKDADYKAMHDLGINVARFYLQYYWMEPANEKALYAYLDKQIEAARRNGVYIILNLHFFGHAKDVATHHEDGFWQGDIAGKGYDIVSFWDRLSKRYHYEPIIAGYDLLNEPDCSGGYLESLLYDEYEKMIKVIRNNGDQHTIIIADPVKKNENPTAPTYLSSRPFKKLDDANIIYEYHFYKPSEFTHQGFFESSFFERGTSYPYTKYEASYKGGFYGNPYWKDTVNGGWQKYEGQWVNLGTQANCTINFETDRFNINLGAARTIGQVWYDDIVLEEKDGKTGKVRRLPVSNPSMTNPKDFSGWQKDPKPSIYTSGWYSMADPQSDGVVFAWDKKQDHTKNGGGSLLIDGRKAKWSSNNPWARWAQDGGARSLFYPIEKGKQYRVSAWIKIAGDNGNNANISFSINKVVEKRIDKQYNADFITNYYESWAKKFNVPLFCGEFGLTNPSLLRLKGASPMKSDDQVAWLTDMLDILDKGYTKNWCYHDYRNYSMRGDLFGLFDKTGADTVLQNVLKKSLNQP